MEFCNYEKKIVEVLQQKFISNTKYFQKANAEKAQLKKAQWLNCSQQSVNQISSLLTNSSAMLCLRLPGSHFPNCSISLNL